jgi:hypothetical protein
MKTCTVDNCTKQSEAKGLCQNHYVQMRRTGSAKVRPSSVQCSQCEIQFVPKRYGPVRSICFDCFKLNESERIKQYGREYHKNNGLMKVYGLTIEQYKEMLINQDYKCAICGDAADGKGAKLRNLCVDHCHTTGKIRGLLCNKCNSGLGQFRDNPGFMLNAIQYLKEKG